MIGVPEWHFETRATITRYQKAVTAGLHVTFEQISNTAMCHDFGNVFFMVGAVGCLVNSQFGTGFRVRPGYDPVEPLFVAVDPQDFSKNKYI